jgi:hypothetical protein
MDRRKLFMGGNLPNRPKTWGYEGTENKLRAMYRLTDFGLIKGVPGSGKGTFMETIANDPIFDGAQRIDYLCSGTLGAQDGIIYPDLGIGYIDATMPHLVNPSAPADRIIDLMQSIIPEKAPTSEQIAPILKRRLEYYGETQAHLTDAVKSKQQIKSPTNSADELFNKLDAMLSEKGIQPISKHIVGIKRAVTSDGIIDYGDTWANIANTELLCANDEVANEVFRRLHEKYGGFAFLNYLQPEKLFEGVHIGGQVIKQHPEFEAVVDQEPMDKAFKALIGATVIMHQEIEGLYRNAIDKDCTEMQ